MAKPSISDYLKEEERGIRFPMSREEFASLTPTTRSNVMQAMSKENLNFSDYVLPDKYSAAMSRAPKKEVYVPSGSATMVDPESGDTYAMTGYGLQQLVARRKAQGLPDLITLPEFQERRAAEIKQRAEKKAAALDDFDPIGEEPQVEQEVVDDFDPVGEEDPSLAIAADVAAEEEAAAIGEEPTEETVEDVPAMAEEKVDDFDPVGEEPEATLDDERPEDPDSNALAAALAQKLDLLEIEAEAEAAQEPDEDTEAEEAEPVTGTEITTEQAVPFVEQLFGPLENQPPAQQQTLMSAFMEALSALPEGMPLSDAVASAEFAQAVSQAVASRMTGNR